MAMIDYGAILKINGKQINDSMFMECPDWVPEFCRNDSYVDQRIKNNYFVYAGDYDFYICFYKTYAVVCSRNKVIGHLGIKNSRESFMFPGANVTVQRIDKNLYRHSYIDMNVLREFLEDWECDLNHFNMKDSIYRNYIRLCKKSTGKHSHYRDYNSDKFVASWDYKGNHYEVAFGYGVEPDEEVYNDIKNDHYEYNDVEREFFDNWFAERDEK